MPGPGPLPLPHPLRSRAQRADRPNREKIHPFASGLISVEKALEKGPRMIADCGPKKCGQDMGKIRGEAEGWEIQRYRWGEVRLRVAPLPREYQGGKLLQDT